MLDVLVRPNISVPTCGILQLGFMYLNLCIDTEQQATNTLSCIVFSPVLKEVFK
jgi:hypothetical protein